MTRNQTLVILVPPLRAFLEHTSMRLYLHNIENALNKQFQSELTLKVLTPIDNDKLKSKFKRQVAKYINYSKVIEEAIRESKYKYNGNIILHILDQHYSYLSRNDVVTVTTCHDLAIFTTNVKENPLLRTLRRLNTRPIANSKKIFAISKNTARDLKEILDVTEEKIVINYYGIDPIFKKMIPAQSSDRIQLLRNLKNEGKVLLHVGTNIGRKNIVTLLKAIALLKQEVKVKLVKVGNDFYTDGFSELIYELGISENIIYLGKLSQSEIVEVYNNCDLFLFPSLYEGFGRPVLEAQACGIPCILANNSSLPEVGGNAALYHETENFHELAQKTLYAISNDKVYDELVKQGLINVKKFSWDKHALILRDTYKQLLLSKDN